MMARLKTIIMVLALVLALAPYQMTASKVLSEGGDSMLTEAKAAKICEDYVTRIYGAEAANSQKPYVISDEGDAWRVTGQPPKLQLGGNFDVLISKSDGAILKVHHSK
ncbi:NTF2 fold immunity protein [Ditylenchus destructor]|nr:NTF2 fold immunity protein [Ditylenchus destructor]